MLYNPINAISNNMDGLHYYIYLLRNRISYYRYVFYYGFNVFTLIRTVAFLYSLYDLIMDIIGLKESSFYMIVLFGISILWTAIDYIVNYGDKYTVIEEIPDYYSNIHFVENRLNNGETERKEWKRIDIKNKNITDRVFVRDEVNAFLQNTKTINYTEKPDYKNLIQKIIRNNWDIYMPYLKRQYLDANYTGSLFFNEKKYGISNEFDETSLNVTLHKTCYYDSFLTDIAPGKKIVYRKNGKVVSELTGDLSCVTETGNGLKQLKNVGEYVGSNHPGVSTLLFYHSKIRLYRQSRILQSSPSKYSPTGSGSVDYNDIKKSGNTSNFVDVVRYGMNRELFEEVFDNPKVIYDDYVDTRIIGYFKWVRKAGKAEFIGISKMKKNMLIKNSNAEHDGEGEYVDLDALTVEDLMNSIKAILSDIENDTVNAGDYSIPVVVALKILYELCEKVSDKSQSPEKVLFE